jgi:hypothetical protein
VDKFGSGRNCGSFMLILRVNYIELKWRVGLLVKCWFGWRFTTKCESEGFLAEDGSWSLMIF